MPRNAAGNYTLPLPPVVTGTTIVASFENTTDTDIATELTNSLDRNGRGGMLAPFKIADGTVSAPGIAFTLDPDNGFYRIGADDWAATVGGVKVMGFTANAVTFTKNVSAPIFFADPGSAAAPAYAIRDANTGIYSASAGVINITLAGTTKYWFDASIFVPYTDNAVTCGSSANRWSQVFTGPGGAAAPSIAVGNANTGLYLAGATWLDVAITGAARYRFDVAAFTSLVDNSASCGAGTSYRWSVVYAATGTISTSDIRLKKDVKDSRLGLAFIEALHPVSYRWITGSNKVVQEGEGEDLKSTTVALPGVRTHWGLIAQDVAKAVEASGVEDFAGYVVDDMKDPDSYLSLRYEEFIGPLIKAVQELSARLKVVEGKPA